MKEKDIMRATGMGQCTYATAYAIAVELVVVHTPLMIKERRTRLPKEAVCTNTGAEMEEQRHIRNINPLPFPCTLFF